MHRGTLKTVLSEYQKYMKERKNIKIFFNILNSWKILQLFSDFATDCCITLCLCCKLWKKTSGLMGFQNWGLPLKAYHIAVFSPLGLVFQVKITGNRERDQFRDDHRRSTRKVKCTVSYSHFFSSCRHSFSLL